MVELDIRPTRDVDCRTMYLAESPIDFETWINLALVAENDRPSDLIPLEVDYRSIGIPEIVFIDPHKKRVRYLRKDEANYDEKFLTSGRLEFVTVPGFWIEIEWLFADEKPEEFTVTQQLIEAAESAE